MPDSSDYRLYLNERFEGLKAHINDEFKSVNTKLDNIEDQTTKTNSRVNHLEDDVDVLRDKLVAHPVECSKAKDIEMLKDDLIEYKFIKRHPYWTTIIIAFFVITLIISSYGTFSTMANNFRDKEMRKQVNEINENTK